MDDLFYAILFNDTYSADRKVAMLQYVFPLPAPAPAPADEAPPPADAPTAPSDPAPAEG